MVVYELNTFERWFFQRVTSSLEFHEARVNLENLPISHELTECLVKGKSEILDTGSGCWCLKSLSDELPEEGTL